jgi:hypothetical protein
MKCASREVSKGRTRSLSDDLVDPKTIAFARKHQQLIAIIVALVGVALVVWANYDLQEQHPDRRYKAMINLGIYVMVTACVLIRFLLRRRNAP